MILQATVYNLSRNKNVLLLGILEFMVEISNLENDQYPTYRHCSMFC